MKVVVATFSYLYKVEHYNHKDNCFIRTRQERKGKLFFGNKRLPSLVVEKDPYLGDLSLMIVEYFDNVFFIARVSRSGFVVALVEKGGGVNCRAIQALGNIINRRHVCKRR